MPPCFTIFLKRVISLSVQSSDNVTTLSLVTSLPSTYILEVFFTDTNLIKRKISQGEDLFQRNIKYKKITIDNTFPEYIIKNKEKFKDWIV